MGQQIIKQPDGGLAVFDPESGTWAEWDLDRAGVNSWFTRHRGEGESAWTGLIGRYIDAVRAGEADRVYTPDEILTFAEAQAHSLHHGGEVLDGPVDRVLFAALDGAPA